MPTKTVSKKDKQPPTPNSDGEAGEETEVYASAAKPLLVMVALLLLLVLYGYYG